MRVPTRDAPVARLPSQTSRPLYPTRSDTRISGNLKSLGHEFARNTIKVILKDDGIAPAPERGTNMPWKTFLAAHWDGLAAADSFTV